MQRQRTQAIHDTMRKPLNIRNMCVIAHVDHGKSTLTDALVCKAGIITEAQAGNRRFTDSREDEQERGITIKSSAVSMYYELDENVLGSLKRDGNGFLVNLIDSPGHVDFSSEVTTALRVTDGALLVVDCVSGVSVQTETVLRQALSERVQLTLIINKVDRCILEQKLQPEELYQKMSSIIQKVNSLVATYRTDEQEKIYDDDHFDPCKGNVAFGAGKQCWAFTIPQFASFYAEKWSKQTKEKVAQKLWGETYFDNDTKKWLTYEEMIVARKDRPTGTIERGFCQHILKPIYRLFNSCMELNIDEVKTMTDKLGVKLTTDELDPQQQDGKVLMGNVMKRWLPAGEAMLHLIVLHLPSPVQAQAYRTDYLYEGPQDDRAAAGMKSCDPNGELMIYISKKIPSTDGARFLCFGRVFSGTISSGQNVRILGPNYQPGTNNDVQVKNVTSVSVMIGDRCISMGSVPAGNVVALSGIDKCLLKTATVTSYNEAHNLRMMKFSVSPVVRAAVDAKEPSDHARVVDGLKKLAQSDSLVQILNENGQHIIAAAGELHLEICIQDLEREYAKCQLKTSTPVVTYRETVTQESSHTAFTKTTNKHNKFFMRAQPLPDGLAEAIENGLVTANHDQKERTRYLVENYQFDLAATKKIWSFGPQHVGPNMLIDSTKGVDGLSNIQDTIVAGFQWASDEGVLCNENLRGVRIDLLDAEIHRDAAHRRPDQIIPAIRRCLLASMHMAEPRILEPVFVVEIECPSRVLGKVYATLNKRRGQIIEEVELNGTSLTRVKSYLPVNESFGFTSELRQMTSGQAFPQCQFDHWQLLPGNPFELDSRSGQIVQEIRLRKSLHGSIPTLDTLIDRQ
ncbi:unnamed protein product [Didymodactylos carnosus]|uniref:Tr-type G domain-containing protein n=1 Tax=Didymodactylos carnosus TaxID=1234261 RepID=A0A814ZLF9_9BILA|nr:unnamed protein product [Didymodactylos carnosus]CAF0733251.1 unnamed protein product [Didymodactylos carnosus]CAF1245431.1 unnamed protein product [Didymodactylos carnosus]CAF3509296.1 unnamed protein product [Didymodactylos carnosus]CAF3509328.1 unnamed protein product [Didymodactylos carnosus]